MRSQFIEFCPAFQFPQFPKEDTKIETTTKYYCAVSPRWYLQSSCRIPRLLTVIIHKAPDNWVESADLFHVFILSHDIPPPIPQKNPSNSFITRDYYLEGKIFPTKKVVIIKFAIFRISYNIASERQLFPTN